MTKADIARLLTLIAAFDRRTIGETDVEAWHLVLADLEPTDCADAVREHYATRRDWLMPADVRGHATAAARRREGQARRAALDAQVAAENAAAVSDRPRPLAALLGGTPIRSAPRGGYDGPSRRVRSGERATQARAELERVRPATSDVATAARSSVEEPAVTGDGR